MTDRSDRGLSRAIEAMLHVSGAPVATEALARACEQKKHDVEDALSELERELTEGRRGLRLLRLPEGVQLVTAREHAATVDRFLKARMIEELTPAASETLAIVAYRGPIHRAGVEAIRGVQSSFTLRLLTLRGLIERFQSPEDQRMILYRVTGAFLRHLGLSRVHDLPDYETLHHHEGMTTLIASTDVPVRSTNSDLPPRESPSRRDVSDAERAASSPSPS